MDTHEETTLNKKKITNYFYYMQLPLKIVACWEWFPNPKSAYEVAVNNVYMIFVLFILVHIPLELAIHLYTHWEDLMGSLDRIADTLPFLVSLAIICYHVIYRKDMYELFAYVNGYFTFYSARGLSNMTMWRSFKTAQNFARVYTACTMFSVTMYATLPVIVHLWTKQPIKSWMYLEANRSPFLELTFLRSCLAQIFVGLAMGQFGVFFASNSILICGQLDLLCCGLRNARYTAMLRLGVGHAKLNAQHSDIVADERYNYIYNISGSKDSAYHYNEKVKLKADILNYDIYDNVYDEPTTRALRECARVSQIINAYIERFEAFVSPLLVLRVVQVTLYLCTLLYAATLKFDMITVEYLAAVALDMFIYCFYGNQIILQADRVSTAAYQSSWHAMGVKPRRVLLNMILANKKPLVIRAGRFLPMDLHTFVVIIKTSFSYYTLLVNVNDK